MVMIELRIRIGMRTITPFWLGKHDTSRFNPFDYNNQYGGSQA
ncbi:hypothetical protein ES332_D05G339100v1 [Gossypium tomentosum]|uniref:Uncharacterized protein n=1 Tax=Gossypium tomentosum TaxID=34277 RepID=A0A5D2L3I1_GOSTO|nr:hypothetical protein ES332_D05G339100v1 [Gossypium tomentosum]